MIGVTPKAGRIALAHERLHLRDLLELLDRDADYPARAFRLCLATLADGSLLDEGGDGRTARGSG